MRRLSLVFAALAALALLGAKAPPTRFDVTVQPEGAQVFIDGKLRGTAPIQLFDVPAGRHLDEGEPRKAPQEGAVGDREERLVGGDAELAHRLDGAVAAERGLDGLDDGAGAVAVDFRKPVEDALGKRHGDRAAGLGELGGPASLRGGAGRGRLFGHGAAFSGTGSGRGKGRHAPDSSTKPRPAPAARFQSERSPKIL